MFCSKCGFQLDDEDVFCQQCGAKVKSVVQTQTTAPTDSKRSGNTELDREALKIYLGNVLALECIKRKLEAKLISTEDEKKEAIVQNYHQYYNLYYNDTYVHLWFNGEKYYVAYKGDVVCQDGRIYYDECEWRDVDLIFFDDWRDDQDISSFFSIGTIRKKKKAFEKILADFKSNAPKEYKKNLDIIQNYDKCYSEITEELKKTEALLKEAYNVNIIPLVFREKIHAIYYLHSFITTSNESLTTAFLQFNLEEIKSKLDKVIEQQQDIIIQQAVMISQNETLIRQNQNQLERLSRIETNTGNAAQYAAIAANNAEACAWIGMANYIK